MLRRLPVDPVRVRRLLGLALGVGLLALLAVLGAAAWLAQLNVQHNGWVTHTYQVERALADFRLPVWTAEAARRGYVVTPNPGALMVYRDAESQVQPALERLAALTRDNPYQQRRVALLRRDAATVQAMRRASLAAAMRGGVTDEMRATWVNESVPVLLRMRKVTTRMAYVEKGLLDLRVARAEAGSRWFIALLIGAGSLVLAVAIIIALTLQRYTTDLTRSRDQLRQLADTLEDTVRERTADLTLANEEIQRFAYIVSHDLRAPLVNVLGFTSELEAAAATISQFVDHVDETAPALASKEARVAAREDLPEAIGFIRTSTRKMDRLINAILKLSREGRRVITPEPIDIERLVGEIAATLKHRLDETGASIRVESPLPAIVSDRLAIEQIFSNLIENATKYLDPSRPGEITVRGRRDGLRVVFEVIDNGRGVDPRDHQRIFDLFRRAGQQDQPGEGIGLAHVRALTYRLGGTVSIASALGAGATFTLNLPATLIETREFKP